MINGSAQYATGTAFRRTLEDRLKVEAKSRGRSLEELRREFLFQRILSIVELSRLHAPPTIGGLTRLSERLTAYPHVMAVAEPTSMTWLGLHVAPQEAGCDLALVGTRHAAPLRGAISGKNKPRRQHVIDADVLAMTGDVFTLSPLRPPTPPQLALRRAVVRRGKLVIDGNRSRRRLISLARSAFPDV